MPELGISSAANAALLQFSKVQKDYEGQRDFPAKNKTSHLSIHLKNGSLTTAQIFAVLGSTTETYPFLRQLVWREFYYHVLWHKPEVEKAAFIDKYADLNWENREDWFSAWKEGQTGFPIVDAGMRQLSRTGEMPNRVRMIVASFLTKDLLIDWRWGEAWFMQHLLDGDMAANNGGWQWAASTGCDPVPYFRIFNPELQSRRFDPGGDYIRKFVPELAGLSDQDIHVVPEALRPKNYPAPIVQHARQKELAVRLFKKL